MEFDDDLDDEDLAGLECDVVVNGVDVPGVSVRVALGLLRDARSGDEFTFIGLDSGRAYAFAGPMQVAVRMPDRVCASRWARFVREYTLG